jgi:hypothetical protein
VSDVPEEVEKDIIGGSSIVGSAVDPGLVQEAGNAVVDSSSLAADAAQSPNPLAGLAQIGDFFGLLKQPATWIRIGQITVGVILLAVGIARITHAVPVATRVAKTVGAAAIV